jgi:hypothetical protein
MIGFYVGQLVTASRHIDASIYMIKKIDTENDRCFIVPIDGAYPGEWYSADALISLRQTY